EPSVLSWLHAVSSSWATAMTLPRSPFLAWPGWRLLREDIVLAAGLALWWAVIYIGADELANRHARRVRIHLDAELHLPFVPAFVLVYRSIDELFLLVPFVLRSRDEVSALTRTLAVVIALAGVGFVSLPAEAAYAPRDAGAWQGLCELNRRL